MSGDHLTRDRPILFAGRLVRAILAGRKSQTRRVIRPEWWRCLDPDDEDDRAIALPQCPYGRPGETLYVRETWRAVERAEDGVDGILFAADDSFVEIAPTHAAAELWMDAYHNGAHGDRWRPSIHLPRWASRLTLRVTDVRIERLQEISEEDAIAEGLVLWSDPPRVSTVHYGAELADVWEADARKAFARLWDSSNGKRAPWASNPWVWVVAFDRVR